MVAQRFSKPPSAYKIGAVFTELRFQFVAHTLSRRPLAQRLSGVGVLHPALLSAHWQRLRPAGRGRPALAAFAGDRLS